MAIDVFRKSITRRARIYEERTGDNLPNNIIAKIGELSALAFFADATFDSNPAQAVAGASLGIAMLIADKRTGGLRGYGVDQEDSI